MAALSDVVNVKRTGVSSMFKCTQQVTNLKLQNIEFTADDCTQNVRPAFKYKSIPSLRLLMNEFYLNEPRTNKFGASNLLPSKSNWFPSSVLP